jgi:lysophospholipase L1-like esterase
MKIAFIGDSLTLGIPGSSYFGILRQRLPQHTLVNLGKGNDTVISLYCRITRLRFGTQPFDMAFLWVGVNDVGGEGSWLFRVANALRRQPRSRSLDEFRDYYRKTLDLLCHHAGRVIAVPPLLKGEALDSPENREVETLARLIEELTLHYERVEFLDLRPTFYPELVDAHSVGFLPQSPLHVGVDILTLRNNAQIDKKAAARGLRFTIDGVHLNSAGAEIVAHIFAQSVVKEQKLQSNG